MPAQHPAAFIYGGEFARMKAALALICRDIFWSCPNDLDQDSSDGRGRQRQEGD
jgi:hypothetical protein